jgi:hypothetical protein
MMSKWYDNIPAQDRPAVDALGSWLRPVPWQWFMTATFRWNVRSETADRKFEEWINLIERELRTRVCLVAGRERKPRSHGSKVPWHFHVLVTAATAIPDGMLAGHWKTVAGEGHKRVVDDKLVDEGILIERYQGHLKGPEYCLKSMNDCNGDWDSRWLRLFHSGIKGTTKPNHQTIRQERRFKEEKQHFAVGFGSGRNQGTLSI